MEDGRKIRSFRCSDDLYERIRKTSRRDGRSQNAQIEWILEQYDKEHGVKEGNDGQKKRRG